jgi:multisubunit Na+/H+ antiporter MnhG subunit
LASVAAVISIATITRPTVKLIFFILINPVLAVMIGTNRLPNGFSIVMNLRPSLQ